MDKIIYLLMLKGNVLTYLNVDEEIEEIEIDTLEVNFKTALMEGNIELVKTMLKD